MGASLFTYILNIFLFPALASFFTVKHPKVPFGRFCYYFANQEIHYNPRYLILFLIITLLLSALGGYELFIDKKPLFKTSQNSGIITAHITVETMDMTHIKQLHRIEKQLKEDLSPSIHLNSEAKLIETIHRLNEPGTPLNEQGLLEAQMYLDMYNFEGFHTQEGHERITITFNPQKVKKSLILNWLKLASPIIFIIDDVDSKTSLSKDRLMHTLTFSLASAMILIGLIMARIFRSKQMALIGFIVNATPIVWLGLFIQLFELPFSFEVLVAMSIALALGSDATIHFTYKFARSRHFGRTQKHSLEIMFFYGGIPVIIGSLVLALSFALLTLSRVYTLELIGIYGLVLMVLSLLTDLLILPVFLLAFDKYKRLTPTR